MHQVIATFWSTYHFFTKVFEKHLLCLSSYAPFGFSLEKRNAVSSPLDTTVDGICMFEKHIELLVKFCEIKTSSAHHSFQTGSTSDTLTVQHFLPLFEYSVNTFEDSFGKGW